MPMLQPYSLQAPGDLPFPAVPQPDRAGGFAEAQSAPAGRSYPRLPRSYPLSTLAGQAASWGGAVPGQNPLGGSGSGGCGGARGNSAGARTGFISICPPAC